MIRLLGKARQYNTTLFHGKLLINKPVMHDINSEVEPYANLFYWSHSIALDYCEFKLHPHKGFEILTFVFEGEVTHFDTQTNVWTPLTGGDFQVIGSGRGIQHAEKIAAGTRSFQIWLDPDYNTSIQRDPVYHYYHGTDFQTDLNDQIQSVDYVGGTSPVQLLSPGVAVRKLSSSRDALKELPLSTDRQYAWYVLNGEVEINDLLALKDDVVKMMGEHHADLRFKGAAEIFMLQLPLTLNYKVIWEI